MNTELRRQNIEALIVRCRGVMARQDKEEMGHKNIQTTAGYCHAEACSVPDPVAVLRRNSVQVAPWQPARLVFQNS